MIFTYIASISMVLSLVTVIVLIYNKDIFKSNYVTFLAIAIGFYLIGNFFEVTSHNADAAIVGFYIKYLGVPFVPTLWLFCVLEFCNIKFEKYFIRLIMLVVPIIIMFLSYTWKDNHLLYSDVKFTNTVDFGNLLIIPGKFYIARLVYQFTINIIGVVIIIVYYIKGTKHFKEQATLFLVSCLIPFFNTMIYAIEYDSYSIDITPYGLTLSMCFFILALYKYGVQNRSDIIKDNALDNLSESVLFFNQKGIFMDSNHSAKEIFPALTTIPMGTSIDEMEYLPFNSTLFNNFKKNSTNTREFIKDYNGEIRTFSISISEVNYKNKNIGYIFILTNITPMKNLLNSLVEKSITDALTNIYNRGYLFDEGQIYVDKAMEKRCSLSVIMFDIDYFKKVNDKFGHSYGDYVLKTVALIASSGLRRSDILARYGGEEFCILMYNAPIEIAMQKAEALREKIAAFDYDHDNNKTTITASFGVANLLDNPSENFYEIVKRADERLYEAKRTGRNKVC